MDDCSICLNTINIPDSINLSCNHRFHKNCILKCIKKGFNFCPNCKKTLTILDISHILSDKNSDIIHTLKNELKRNLLKKSNISIILPPEYLDNMEIINLVLSHHPEFLKEASERIQKLKCLDDWKNIKYVSENIKRDRIFISGLLHQNWQIIRFVSHIYSDDEEFINYAITSSGLAIKYASDRIKNNNNYIIKALKDNGFVIKYLPNIHQTNRNYINIAKYHSKIKNIYIY